MPPLTAADLPLFIQLVADATSVGKTFGALRFRDHCDEAGIANVLVRIETRGVKATLRKGNVSIAVEDFAIAI